MKRRNFLQTAAISTTALALPSILSASIPAEKESKPGTNQKRECCFVSG
jgi:hypothetical protein